VTVGTHVNAFNVGHEYFPVGIEAHEVQVRRSVEENVHLAEVADGYSGLEARLPGARNHLAGAVFPAIAVDRGSGLHVAFNDGRNSYLTCSADLGATWNTPIRLNNSADGCHCLTRSTAIRDRGNDARLVAQLLRGRHSSSQNVV
jgi:hypothetical protein